ncbi:Hypothetical predicted protein, partial [Paramuricea clavata]
MFEKISTLVGELTETFSSWLIQSAEVDDEKVSSTKKLFNEISMKADDTLVKLRSIAPAAQSTLASIKEKTPPSNPKLRKIDFRPLDKNCPKNWFEDLEIVFTAMGVSEENLKYAALLRLVDAQTSNLLTTISRKKPDDSYSQARDLIISEFQLSKFDRARLYLLDSSPGPEENLSHFASRIEVLFDDLSLDDIRKFTVLRHAPSAVRLQLAGSGFDAKGFTEL